MASAQVLPSSRKLGHLEAGKKRLEEFRKKKAEGRAKKVASTGQLQSADVEQFGKLSQKHEHATDETISARDDFGVNDSSGFLKAQEDIAVSSTHGANTGSSTGEHANTSVWVDSNHVSHDNLRQESQKDELSILDENSGFPQPNLSRYENWRGVNGEVSSNEELKFGSSGGAESLYAINPFHAKPDVERNNHIPSSFPFVDVHSENKINSKFYSDYPDASGSNLKSTLSGKSASFLEQNRLGITTTSVNSSTFEESTTGLGLQSTGNLNQGYFTDNRRGRSIADSINRHLNVDHGAWRVSEPSSADIGLSSRSSHGQHLFPYVSSGTIGGRSRPSFLDALGVPRASSTAFAASSIPEKSNSPMLLGGSNFLGTEVQSSPSNQLLAEEANAVDHSLNLESQGSSEKEFLINPSNSLNNGPIAALEGRDHDAQGQGHQEFLSTKKDEGFAALEQHIEDLTQEKFSLQRALEKSQALAESLAAENSSLTDSYNQQGEVVNQLKSDMERLQEEIKAQQLAFESVKMEYVNAQMECNASDERAKILASEVIGLEEKALRLRSNELKLEKQSESLNYEISSYKRKVSILEKERQDFQSTVDALQEEKKLLQSKLRKVSDLNIIDSKKASPLKKDAATFTDEEFVGVAGFSAMNVRGPSVLLPNDASTSSLTDDIGVNDSDASNIIPHDQLRMIDNINSLISELALEKEELMRALKTESHNNSKLKDLNKDLSQKLEIQTQRLELLTAQRMANENVQAKPSDIHTMNDSIGYADEGDEVVERVLGWIMKLFPGGPAKRRTSKLL
ncbi:Actin filament-coating protein tropomyosin protein [Dioscorea alata]|uniref:Actin filament-coating protein tropomyosin protein n=1 Tax=Dioscorea alata TaxID=55571 RepID=A0ACB7W3V7_DIOAL|nr:Actin filament-coating protein tropomyosin protein [Dioscorea alata]